jgi:hypothetical protein
MQLAGEVWRDLAVIKTLDGEGESLICGLGRRDGVAALRLIPVVCGQAHVHMLPGLMSRPPWNREHKASDPWSLVDEVDHLGGAPDQSPL